MSERKTAQSQVSYSPGMGEHRCGNCVHYGPRASCSLVEGFIRSDYWCELFTNLWKPNKAA